MGSKKKSKPEGEPDEPRPIVVKNSTPEERAKGTRIVRAMLGTEFRVDWNFPKNTGQQGDEGVRGDTACIATDDADAARSQYESMVTDLDSRLEAQDPLGRVSDELCNNLPAVTRVLYEIVVVVNGNRQL